MRCECWKAEADRETERDGDDRSVEAATSHEKDRYVTGRNIDVCET